MVVTMQDFCTILYVFLGIRVYYVIYRNSCNWFWMNCFRIRLFGYGFRDFTFIVTSIYYFIIYYIILVFIHRTHLLNWGYIRTFYDVHDAIWASIRLLNSFGFNLLCILNCTHGKIVYKLGAKRSGGL